MAGVSKYTEQVRENKEIEYNGLIFHPLTVREYDFYLCGKAAFELMMSSLPPKLARLSWCAALLAIDEEAHSNVFYGTAMNVLARVLKLPTVEMENGAKGYLIKPICKDGVLVGIYLQNENIVLTVQQMDEVRQIISEQNGYQIPDERWNPELVADAKYTQAQNMPNLKTDIEDWVCSVAVNCGCEAEDIWGWPIRKFLSYDKAIDRKLGYQIFTLAQAVGLTKFENGAPYPTWRYDKQTELPHGFKTMTALEAKAKGQLPEAETQ